MSFSWFLTMAISLGNLIRSTDESRCPFHGFPSRELLASLPSIPANQEWHLFTERLPADAQHQLCIYAANTLINRKEAKSQRYRPLRVSLAYVTLTEQESLFGDLAGGVATDPETEMLCSKWYDNANRNGRHLSIFIGSPAPLAEEARLERPLQELPTN